MDSIWRRSCSHRHHSSCVDKPPTKERIPRDLTRRQRRVRCEPRGQPGRALAERPARARHRRSEDGARARDPSAQRRPLLGRREAPSRRRADCLAHLLGALACVAPERQRVRDRRQRVPHPWPDPARNDDQDRPARGARVAAAEDLRVRRLFAGLVRALDAAGAQTMADDRQRLTRLPARRFARWTVRRPGRCARGDPACPRLDVEPGMNDSIPASRSCCKQPTSPRSTADHGARYTARHLFDRPRAGASLRTGVTTATGDCSARNPQAARWPAAAIPSRSLRENPPPALIHRAR